MRNLYVAWQNPKSRQWFVVGRLLYGDDEGYVFEYTKGALEANKKGHFHPFTSFPKMKARYTSDRIFPMFANRILSSSRPEYESFKDWMNIQNGEDEMLALLARSGGERQTDTLEVFPSPERENEGKYTFHFFVHGLRHQADCAIDRAKQLKAGESLFLMQDPQNPADSGAVAVRTAEKFHGDMHLMGYLPRYLADEANMLLKENSDLVNVTVARVNQPPAPVQFRILCRIKFNVSDFEYEPFSDSRYRPVEQNEVVKI